MAVRYINGGQGAFVTTDGGTTWKLLCNSSVFDPTTRGGPLVVTGDGTTIIGAFNGMWHDDGHDCGWTEDVQYDGEWISNFAVDPLDPTITYALTSSGGKQNGILRRDASGKWTDFGTKAALLLDEVRVVPHGTGRRFYVGAVNGTVAVDGGTSLANYVIRVSDDDGATWTEHAYGATDGTLAIQAVDPSNPDRIVVSIERPEDAAPPAVTTDTVRVSDDQGATFKDYLTVTEIGGVAFAPDGRVWIGDAGGSLNPDQPEGLYFASSIDKAAKKVASDYPVQCLAYQPATSTLLACQRWSVGPIDATKSTFTTSLDVRTVANFVECAGVDMAATCEDQVCSAYCGFGHFAQAPICCAYDTPTCGPVASPIPTSCPVRDAGVVDAGIDGSAGAGGAGGSEHRDGGTAVGGTHFDAGTSFGFGTGATSATKKNSDGSCAVAVVQTQSRGLAAEALSILAASFALRRRGRRRVP